MIQTLAKIPLTNSREKEQLKRDVTQLEEELIDLVESFTHEELLAIKSQNHDEKYDLTKIVQ